MSEIELKPNQEIGVFYYDDNRGSKAAIEVIKSITPSGYITLQNGKRYTPKGKEIAAPGIPTHLVSVERAKAIIDKAIAIDIEREERQQAHFNSCEGRRKVAVKLAVEAAIKALNGCGWYADEHGHLDNMEEDLKKIIVDYVNNHDPAPKLAPTPRLP